MEVFSDWTHFLKSLVICDLRFESHIGIAVQSPDLEHLVQGCPEVGCRMMGEGGVGLGKGVDSKACPQTNPETEHMKPQSTKTHKEHGTKVPWSRGEHSTTSQDSAVHRGEMNKKRHHFASPRCLGLPHYPQQC